MNESGGGVDIHGCAYHDEIVGLFAHLGGGFDIGYRFAKPDDMGPQLCPVGSFVAKVYVAVADVDDEIVVAVAAGFGQFAMQMEHVGGAGLFVEIVDVLGDYLDIVFFF